MDAAERFGHLMKVIEYWTEDGSETDRYAGPFRHLSRDLWIREICVTPGCSVSVAQLKTFFASAVLEIYPWNNKSKVSYRDIQKSLSGERAAKKYSFFFGELEKCFSVAENAEAAGKTWLCRGSLSLMGDMEGKEAIPLYLLEKLQAMARIKIGEYWRLCDPDSEQSGIRAGGMVKWKQKTVRKQDEDDDEVSVQKQNKYMECLMTVALHEIFVRECERQLRSLQEEIDAGRGCVGSVKEKVDTLADMLLRADEESARVWEEDTKGSVQELMKYTKRVSQGILLLSEYMEHVIGVETELLLIMILETNNLEIMKRDVGLGRQMAKYLECIRDRSTESFLRYNKNRGKYYRQLEAEIQKIVFRYMEHIGEAAKQSFSEAMHTYLTIAEDGRFDEEKRRKLWAAQCVLVMPLWHAGWEADGPETESGCGSGEAG